MRNVRANARFWIAGIAIAAAGVVLARFLAPSLPAGHARLCTTVSGQLLALVGLGLICVGVSRRVSRAAPAGSDRSEPDA
ncbi:MAG TPA: hypothetical protein VHE61_03045 [Opitutaceae bacterium]|nr:hypothetical protein [Opitutaceae bacterium]